MERNAVDGIKKESEEKMLVFNDDRMQMLMFDKMRTRDADVQQNDAL